MPLTKGCDKNCQVLSLLICKTVMGVQGVWDSVTMKVNLVSKSCDLMISSIGYVHLEFFCWLQGAKLPMFEKYLTFLNVSI